MSDMQVQIEKLCVKVGDAVVVSVAADWLTADQRMCIRESCLAALPRGVKVLVLDSRMRLTIVAAPPVEIDPCSAEVLGFDVWMHGRTERAHSEHMERIRSLPPCDTSIEGVVRYMGAPV